MKTCSSMQQRQQPQQLRTSQRREMLTAASHRNRIEKSKSNHDSSCFVFFVVVVVVFAVAVCHRSSSLSLFRLHWNFCGLLAHRITLDDLILAFRFFPFFLSLSAFSHSLHSNQRVTLCVADFSSTHFIWVSDI